MLFFWIYLMQFKNIFFIFVATLFFLSSAQASFFNQQAEESGEATLRKPTVCPSSQIQLPVALLQEFLEESSDFFQATTIECAGYVFSLSVEASDEKSRQIFLDKDASRKALFYPVMAPENKDFGLWSHRGAWGLTFYISTQFNVEKFESQEETYTFHPGSQIQIPLSFLRSYLKEGVQYTQNNMTDLGVEGFNLCTEGDGSLASFDKIYRNRMHTKALFYPSFDPQKAAQGS
jgi:hypothetical protein